MIKLIFEMLINVTNNLWNIYHISAWYRCLCRDYIPNCASKFYVVAELNLASCVDGWRLQTGILLWQAIILHVTSTTVVGVTKPISSVPLFYDFLPLSMHMLAIEYHIYIWQVSPQLKLRQKKKHAISWRCRSDKSSALGRIWLPRLIK